MNSPHEVINALVTATSSTSYIIGNLHALHYNRDSLSEGDRALCIKDAKSHAEALLVAILQAEKAVAKPAPSTTVTRIGDHDEGYRHDLYVVAAEMARVDAGAECGHATNNQGD